MLDIGPWYRPELDEINPNLGVFIKYMNRFFKKYVYVYIKEFSKQFSQCIMGKFLILPIWNTYSFSLNFFKYFQVWIFKLSNTLNNYTIRCKKLATIVSGRKYVARPFVRRKQVSTSAEIEIWQQRQFVVLRYHIFKYFVSTFRRKKES